MPPSGRLFWGRWAASVYGWANTYNTCRPGEWRSGQYAPPGVLKVLGSNPAFSTKLVTCLLQLNEATKGWFCPNIQSFHQPIQRRFLLGMPSLFFDRGDHYCIRFCAPASSACVIWGPKARPGSHKRPSTPCLYGVIQPQTLSKRM
jgi:hypothetical protein